MIPADKCEICGRADARVVPVSVTRERQSAYALRVCVPHADDLVTAFIERARELHEREGRDSVRVLR